MPIAIKYNLRFVEPSIAVQPAGAVYLRPIGTANAIIENGSHTKTHNRLNDNAKKKEWLELWQRINHKYAYTVSFNSDELIEKCVNEINAHLEVTRLAYIVTKSEQKDEQTKRGIETEQGFGTGETQTEELRTDVVATVKYDLIGKVAENTTLTRRTVAAILSNIRPAKFAMYRQNPEEFISKCSRMIREQKANMIVDHISYNQIEETYESDIFVEEKWEEDYGKAFCATKLYELLSGKEVVYSQVSDYATLLAIVRTE